MAKSIPNLWPPEIGADTLTPYAILLTQAEALEKQTRGILTAEVPAEDRGDERMLSFDVIARPLGYRQRLFHVKHDKDMVYPALVVAEQFRARTPFDVGRALEEAHAGKKPANQADSDDELLRILRSVFQSTDVKALVQSLVARCNEAEAAAAVRSATKLGPPTSPVSGGAAETGAGEASQSDDSEPCPP
jgi:hypothetical protein